MSKAYSTEVIELQDWDKKISIRPLPIKYLRRVYAKIEEISSGKNQSDMTMLDLMIQAVAIAMEKFEPELSDPETLEDYVDMPTLEHILEVVAGIKLNDPNLQAEMAAAAKAQAGTKGSTN